MNGNKTRNGETQADVIVLGVGTCGEDLSLRLLDAGLDVVGIEPALVGGECAYWACLPSKMMIRAASALQEARRVEGLAGHTKVTPDWGPVAERVRQATGGWDDSGAVKRYHSRGGRLFHEPGRLVGPRTVAVGDTKITARRGVVIATGSRPAIPPIPGLEDVDYWTTHDLIQLESLPASLLVLGGGAVGCELGQVMARFGVEVTLVEAGPRLLPAEEPEVSAVVQEAFQAEGITVHTGAAVQQAASRDGSIVLTLAGGAEVAAEQLLVATGRKVDLRGLGLESVGLDETAPRLETDGRMRAAEGLWAMGDVTGRSLFTHVALYQSAIIAADLLGEEAPPARYHAVPRATFTDPEVGAVGLTEAEARAGGREVTVVVKQLPATFRGWVHGAERGVIKLVVDRRSGTLLGAAAAGPQGAELLGLLTLAVHERMTVPKLRSMIFAFPTFHGAIGEALGAYGRGVTTVMDPSYQGVAALDAVPKRDGAGAEQRPSP